MSELWTKETRGTITKVQQKSKKDKNMIYLSEDIGKLEIDVDSLFHIYTDKNLQILLIQEFRIFLNLELHLMMGHETQKDCCNWQ